MLEPTLHFHPKSALFHIGLEGGEPKRQRLTLTVELAGSHECELMTVSRRSLRSANWAIMLLDEDHYSEQAKADKSLGLLSHVPENEYWPESCCIEVAVDSPTFQKVYEVLREGKLPSVISVSSRGLEYGPGSDGRTKVWNIDADSNLDVAKVSITIPLVADSEPSVEEFEAPAHLATSADANAIRQEVTGAIVQMQNKVIAQTRWLIGIGVGILILLATHFK